MADIQKQVENRVGQLDEGNKLRDYTAAQAIVRAKELGITSITMANYAALGYRERLGKPNAEKIAQLDRIFQKIKQEWSGILDATKRDTGKVKSLFETRKKLSDQEVENSALSKLDKANEFKFINTELNKAFTKDLEGHFIEGGILGMLNNPNTALRKAIKNIGNKYGEDLAAEVERALREISGSMQTAQAILNQKTSGARKVGEGLASVVGYRNGSKLEKYWATNPNFRKYMARNLRNQLIGGGISILIGVSTGTFYGGMMKTPLKIQSVPTPSKDIVAMALYGGDANARDIMQGSIYEIQSYIERGLKSGKVNQEKAAQIQSAIGEGLVIDSRRLEQDLNQAENSFRNFIDKIPLLGLATDDERPLRNKIEEYGKLTQKINKSPQEVSRAYKLYAELSNKLYSVRARETKRGTANAEVAIQTTNDVITGTRLAPSVEALRNNNPFKAFLDSHREKMDDIVPNDPETQAAIRAYYEGNSYAGRTGENLVSYIWNSRETGGVQAMYRAFAQGIGKTSYLINNRQTGDEKKINTSRDKWGGNIYENIRNPQAVHDYITSHANQSGLTLVNGYSEKLSALTGNKVRVLPGAIARGVLSGSYQDRFQGQNTGQNTSSLKENNYDGPALVFRADATIDGHDGQLEIGVKPDCANLVIGRFSAKGYYVENPMANIKLRVPLLYTVKKAEQAPTTKKTKTVEKSTPQKSVTPTRTPPTRPTRTPPTRPGRPPQQVSSTPSGNVIEAPTAPGYNANTTETFHQTINNTAIQPGPNVPGIDGIAPPAGSSIPVNTTPQF